MYCVCERKDMLTGLQWGIMKERTHLEYLDVYGRIIQSNSVKTS
jgi:hypothetical protein